MPRKPRKCIYCKKDMPPSKERVQKYCSDCGTKNMLQTSKDMRAKKGPRYEKWKKNHAAGLIKYLER